MSLCGVYFIAFNHTIQRVYFEVIYVDISSNTKLVLLAAGKTLQGKYFRGEAWRHVKVQEYNRAEMREEPENTTNPSAADSIYFTYLSTGKICLKEKNVPWLFFQPRIVE